MLWIEAKISWGDVDEEEEGAVMFGEEGAGESTPSSNNTSVMAARGCSTKCLMAYSAAASVALCASGGCVADTEASLLPLFFPKAPLALACVRAILAAMVEVVSSMGMPRISRRCSLAP